MGLIPSANNKGSRIGYACLAVLLLLPVSGLSQETDHGFGYQSLAVNNPSVAGVEEYGTFRLSYINHYPGQNYNFHSVYFSYDSYFQSVHGGASVFLTNDYLGGIVNDLRGGVAYSYHLQAGRELYINAGLSASFFHRGFNFSDALFPDQIDMMGSASLPTSENLSDQNRTIFDVGSGFMLMYRNYSGGLAITHLAQPDLNNDGEPVERLKRKYFFHIKGDFELGKRSGMEIEPLLFAAVQGDYFGAGAGASAGNQVVAANVLLMLKNSGNTDIQAGFSFRKENLAFFYNYRFNLLSGNSLLPFSLAHQTGLTYRLNKVEKRLKYGTIKLPLI